VPTLVEMLWRDIGPSGKPIECGVCETVGDAAATGMTARRLVSTSRSSRRTPTMTDRDDAEVRD